MAASLREAFAVAGIEMPIDAMPLSSQEDTPARARSWGYRFGIPEPSISRHAAERFRERFGSKDEDLDGARDRLRERIDIGRVDFLRERPSWLVTVPRVGRQYAENSAGFLIVDDEMALPMRKGNSRTHPYYIVTCIPRV